MKKCLNTLIAISLCAGPVVMFAAEKKTEKPAVEADAKKKTSDAKSPKKPAPKLSDVSVSGKVAKKETKGKDGKTYRYYSVTTEDGKTIRLTKSALGKKSKVNLDDLVDAQVTVSGQGYEAGSGKKKRLILKKIAKIEKADVTGG